MNDTRNHIGRRPDRRGVLGIMATGAAIMPFAAWGQGLGGLLGGASGGSGLGGLLVKASDRSLDRLAQPGAFYEDPDIRIGLPQLAGLGGGSGGLGSLLGSAIDIGSQLGITDNFVRTINDAAGVAAGRAKPIFRDAINGLTLADVPGIATRDDGATRYLRESAGGELKGALRPLVDDGLSEVGAYRQLEALTARSDTLSQVGLTADSLGDGVTGQALDGIFSYIGREEAAFRANPLGGLGGLLGRP